MKTKFIILILVVFTLFCKAQTNTLEVYDNTFQNIFANLEKERIPHGLLLDAAVDYIDLKKYDGSSPDSSLKNYLKN